MPITPDTALFKGGLVTVQHDKSSAEYLKMLAVYGAAQFTGTPATAEGHIMDDVSNTLGAVSFAQFNGLTHGMKRIYGLVARYGLVRSITLQIPAAFPHADLAADFAYIPLASLKLQHENGIRAFEFFVEMQNQISQYSKTAANIRTYLDGLGLPSTASAVYHAAPERARLAVAVVRMYQSDNWNGTNDPGNAGFRITANNIRDFKHQPEYVNDIEIRSWLAEAEGISAPFGGAMQVLNQDTTGVLPAWNALTNLYDRNIGNVSLEANVWQAWMLGHGYDPQLVITAMGDDYGDFSIYTNRLQIVPVTLDAVPAKFKVQLVIGQVLSVDTVDLTISGFAPEYASATVTKVDGALTVNTLTLDAAGLMTIEMTGGPIVAGTHDLCTINLDDAPLNATLMNKRLVVTPTDIQFAAGAPDIHTSLFTGVPFRYRVAVEDAQFDRALPPWRDDGTRR